MLLYRYLLIEYLKVLFFCIFSFIAILMTTRLEDIAYFAAYGGRFLAILKFVGYQIPYILPLVIPAASLVSAILTLQRLSQSQELTTLRASGLSLRNVLTPLLLTAGLVSILNFYIVSELATTSLLKSRQLQHQVNLVNPLTLIHHKQLTHHRDIFLRAKAPSLARNSLEDVTVGIWNGGVNRINLVIAKELTFEEPMIRAKKGSLLSSFHPTGSEGFDNLYLENVLDSTLDVEGFTLYLKQRPYAISPLYLRGSLLLTEIARVDAPEKQIAELMRRVSVGLIVFTFTLLGAAFGISIGRRHSYSNVYSIIGCAAFILICLFGAKTFEKNLLMSGILYFVPQLLVQGFSLFHLYRISRGIE